MTQNRSFVGPAAVDCDRVAEHNSEPPRSSRELCNGSTRLLGSHRGDTGCRQHQQRKQLPLLAQKGQDCPGSDGSFMGSVMARIAQLWGSLSGCA